MKKIFQSKKLILLLTIFIDLLGIGIIIPILPYYVVNYGASAFVVTALFAIFSLLSFFSSPLLGSLSDKLGRKPILIISLLSTSLGWFIFAWAPNILWLFIGRIIDGLAAGNFVVAQSYLLDVSEKKEKTASLGLIGAIFGLGMIIGPAIAGPLSEVFIWLPFALVGVLAFLNTIFVWLFLLESKEREVKKISFNPLKPLVQAFKSNTAKANLWSWFFFNLAISLMQAVLVLYLAEAFSFVASQTSLVMTAIGILIVINQTILLKKFWLKIMSEYKIQYMMLFFLVIGFIGLSLANLYLSFIALIFTTLGQGVLRPVMTSQIVKHYPESGSGEILGVANSLASLAVVIGPLMGGALFMFGFSWPFMLATVFIVISIIILFFLDSRSDFEKYVPKNI